MRTPASANDHPWDPGIIIDDSLKADEAMSDVSRTGVNETYDRTIYSRLDDKRSDRIIIVQQRLHVDDLVGHVLQRGIWAHLNLPVIAEKDEEIPIGRGRFHMRKIGDVLHPERESLETLNAIKIALGNYDYYAQYQQCPVPPEGAVLQRDWFPIYDEIPERRRGDRIIQSWDTALTDGKSSDYSVCITFLERGVDFYILDVLREKLNYPDLRRCIYRNWLDWGAEPPIIEDKGSGISLIQDLRGDDFPRFPKAIAFKPEGDKLSRMHAQSAKIEAGQVHVPRHADWLDDFFVEIMQFPRGRHDDQVDALSQFLCWISAPRHRTIIRELNI